MEGALTQLSTHGHFITLSRYLIRLVLINALSLLNHKAHSYHCYVVCLCDRVGLTQVLFCRPELCNGTATRREALYATDATLAIIRGNDHLKCS